MDIDAIGTYTVAKVVYDMWMKVISNILCPLIIHCIGEWRSYHQCISYSPLYWNCPAGKVGEAASAITRYICCSRHMQGQLKLQ